MTLRGKTWLFPSVDEKVRILELVVMMQLEREEAFLAEIHQENRVHDCERRVEDFLMENGVELGHQF